MRNLALVVIVAVLLQSCGSITRMFDQKDTVESSPSVARSEGERLSGYTYVPLDPFSVFIEPGLSCFPSLNGIDDRSVPAAGYTYRPLLESFPDNAVRMSVEQLDVSGNATYGPAGVGFKDQRFRVIVDYINADTISVALWIKKLVMKKDGDEIPIGVVSPVPDDAVGVRFLVQGYTPTREEQCADCPGGVTYRDDTSFETIYLPVYVGIGLRVTADVEVVGATANIGGLGAIGFEAEAENLKGSLVVQTLGINGRAISAALPLQSDLNRTTAQNAIVSIGSIKALLYEEDTVTAPRIVGLYLPFPGGKDLVNAIVSAISEKKLSWQRPCQKVAADA